MIDNKIYETKKRYFVENVHRYTNKVNVAKFQRSLFLKLIP